MPKVSQVSRESTHDKVMFDHCDVATFLAERDGIRHKQIKLMMRDLGYLGIQKGLSRFEEPTQKPSDSIRR
jgi:hypothetical protein